MSEEGQPRGFQELYDSNPHLSVYRYRTGAFQVINRMQDGQEIAVRSNVHPYQGKYSVSIGGYDRNYGGLVGTFDRDPRTVIVVRREEALQATVTYPTSDKVARVEPAQMISTLRAGLELFDAYLHQVPIEKRSQYYGRITDEMESSLDPLGESLTTEEVAAFNPQLASVIGEHLPGMRGYPTFLLTLLRNNPTLLDSISIQK